MSTSYDALIINSDGTGPVRHAFTTLEKRNEFLTTHDPINYILQTVNNLTGEILDDITTPAETPAENPTEPPTETPIHDSLQGR